MSNPEQVYILTPSNPSDDPWPPSWLVHTGRRLRAAYSMYINACQLLDLPIDEFEVACQLVENQSIVGDFPMTNPNAYQPLNPAYGPVIYAAGRLVEAAEIYIEQCEIEGVLLRPVDFVLRLVSGRDMANEYHLTGEQIPTTPPHPSLLRTTNQPRSPSPPAEGWDGRSPPSTPTRQSSASSRSSELPMNAAAAHPAPPPHGPEPDAPPRQLELSAFPQLVPALTPSPDVRMTAVPLHYDLPSATSSQVPMLSPVSEQHTGIQKSSPNTSKAGGSQKRRRVVKKRKGKRGRPASASATATKSSITDNNSSSGDDGNGEEEEESEEEEEEDFSEYEDNNPVVRKGGRLLADWAMRSRPRRV
ncbi:hypothetical protein CF326_g4693, partial [Tilletia indica]